MYIAITILIFLAALLLILIVLVQNSKGGGLSSGFSATNQVMGVRKTTDFLEKATWTLAGLVVVLSVVSAAFVSTSDDAVEKQSIIKEEVENAVKVDPNITSPNFNNQGQEQQGQAQQGQAQQGQAQQAPAQEGQAQQAAPQQAPAQQAPAAKK